ncbi:MAG: hypothetical protein ACR2NP_04190 [Pirellulaceae bacterium]
MALGDPVDQRYTGLKGYSQFPFVSVAQKFDLNVLVQRTVAVGQLEIHGPLTDIHARIRPTAFPGHHVAHSQESLAHESIFAKHNPGISGHLHKLVDAFRAVVAGFQQRFSIILLIDNPGTNDLLNHRVFVRPFMLGVNMGAGREQMEHRKDEQSGKHVAAFMSWKNNFIQFFAENASADVGSWCISCYTIQQDSSFNSGESVD